MRAVSKLDWSPQQQGAIGSVSSWLEDPSRQVFYLAGYAGTGKTTLARHLAEGVDGSVLFGAYTGKAAYILRQRGCHGAMTIHKMIYRPKDKSKKRLKELEQKLSDLGIVVEPTEEQIKEREELEREIKSEIENLKRPSFQLDLASLARYAALIVIDEVSMVGSRMGEDLLSFDKKVLVLGDPAQLPPIGEGGYFTGRKPDVMLEEIHRQAEGSPIIAMATKVRRGEGLTYGDYGEGCEVLPKGRLKVEDLVNANIVLAGRNRTRKFINEKMREFLGFSGLTPMPGEQLVCLRNNSEVGVLNGEIWNVLESDPIGDDRVFLTLEGDDSERIVSTEAHAQYFRGEEPPWYEKREADEFDYGYCLTVHKAQGSQWDDVVVVDESSCFREDARKWLYTAVTRAAKRVRVTR